MAILFSRLIAFVECCVAVPANRIGSKTMTLEQGIRYLSREEKVRHITGRPRKVVKRLIVPKKKRKPERTRPSGSSPDLKSGIRVFRTRCDFKSLESPSRRQLEAVRHPAHVPHRMASCRITITRAGIGLEMGSFLSFQFRDLDCCQAIAFGVWRLAFRGWKFLDLLAKFADGFTVAKMPLMPCCIILRRTTHHHDKPFCVKITEVVNKNVETFGSKLVVWNHCHDWSSITKSTGLAIRIPPNSCDFFVIPLSVVRNQSQEAASNIFHRPTFHHRLYSHLGHGFKMNAQIRLRTDSYRTSRSRA